MVNRVFVAESVHIAVQHILHGFFVIDRADEIGAYIRVHLQQLVEVDAAFAFTARADDVAAELGLIGGTQQDERGHKRDQTREENDQQNRCQAELAIFHNHNNADGFPSAFPFLFRFAAYGV